MRDAEAADGFLGQLRSARKTIARAALIDVDAFVRAQATRLSRRIRKVADASASRYGIRIGRPDAFRTGS